MFLLLACGPGENNIKLIDPEILVQTEVVDFGDVVVDYPSAQELLITSTSTKELTISEITVESDQGDVFSVGELPPPLENEVTWPLQVVFTPRTYLAYTGVLSIYSDDPDDSPVVVTLTGNGTQAPTPDITVEPLSYDFGEVSPGLPVIGGIVIRNDGDGQLEITGVDQAGADTFEVLSSTTYTLDPEEFIQFPIGYTPISELGDNGSIIIHSNDPDEPDTTVILLGNGGGDYAYPVALIDGPTTTEPRQTVTFDGSGSYDPMGYELVAYDWTVLSPPGSAAVVTTATEEMFLQTDIAGIYTVQLQVTNSIGLQSTFASHLLSAIPNEELHVEMYWNTGSADVDLHLSNSGGGFFETPYDINYCNQTAEWGESGDDDDPSLDIDDTTGYGPENINVSDPAEDTYTVRVHYYEDNGDSDVTVTVNLYLRGELTHTFSKVLSRNQVWDVATIDWTDDSTTTVVTEGTTDPSTASRRACYQN